MSGLQRLAVRLTFCVLVLCGLSVSISLGQPSIVLSEDAEISLITVYPGDQLHNLFGHSALRVTDPYHGFDLLYNYGTFQFDSMFLPKFIYGKLDYMLWVSDIRREIQRYQSDGRSVIEQDLALTQEQEQAVFDFLQVNALKENRTYRYDFLFDNCSTRIRDVFEHILGDSLVFHPAETPEKSFRNLLDPYIESKPFLDAGIDLALAMPTDEKATSRDEMFLPINLLEAFDRATVESSQGDTPLVGEKRRIYWNSEEQEAEAQSPWALYTTTWLLFVMALWVSNGKSKRARTAAKWFDRAMLGFCGFAGLLALFLWLIAIHQVTNYNWNLLWAWPTHLVALFALSRSPAWLKPYMRVYAFVVFITILGWFIWPQEMHPAYIPMLLALAVRSVWWGWQKSESEEDVILYPA